MCHRPKSLLQASNGKAVSFPEKESLKLLNQLFEGIKDFESRAPEVPIIAGRDSQPMPARRGRYIAVFDGHSLAGFIQQAFLPSPDLGHRNVEPMDSSLERVDQPGQPALQLHSLASILCTDPVSELCDYNCAGVAAVLFLLEPGDNPRIAVALGRLTDDIRVE